MHVHTSTRTHCTLRLHKCKCSVASVHSVESAQQHLLSLQGAMAMFAPAAPSHSGTPTPQPLKTVRPCQPGPWCLHGQAALCGLAGLAGPNSLALRAACRPLVRWVQAQEQMGIQSKADALTC